METREKLVETAEILKVKHNRKSNEKLNEDIKKKLAEVNEEVFKTGKSQVQPKEKTGSKLSGKPKGKFYLGKCPRTGKKLYK